MLGNIFGSTRSDSEMESEIDEMEANMRLHLRGPSETFEMSEQGTVHSSISISPNREDQRALMFDATKLDEIEQIFELHSSGHSGHFLTKDDFVKTMEAVVPSMTVEDMETIFDEYDKEKKGIIHWKPIIEELRQVKVESGSNADASLMDFFAGKLTGDELDMVDISAMTKQMTSDPMVQALFTWYREEGEPAIERVNELEQILYNERAERAKVEKELRMQLESALKKKDLVMRHCEVVEKDLEAQIEKHKRELNDQKNKSKNNQEQTHEQARDRRDRYSRIIQEKDKELKKVRMDYLDLTKKHNALREELETITSDKIDAETGQKLAEDKHALMERRIEQLQEHTKNQLKSSKERESKLREQIKELSEYYARRSSIFMNRESGEMDANIIIKMSKDNGWSTHNLDTQLPKSQTTTSLTSVSSDLPRNQIQYLQDTMRSSMRSTARSISRTISSQSMDSEAFLVPSPKRAMSVQIDNTKLPKLDVKNRSHWELVKGRRASAANLLSLQSAYNNTLKNLRDQLGSLGSQPEASPEPGVRIENIRADSKDANAEDFKSKLREAEETIKGLKERLRITKRDKENAEKKYNSLEQNFKENVKKISSRKQDSRIKRVMDSIYSDLNRRQDETILETLQTFQRELHLRNTELTKLQHENAQLRGSQAGDSKDSGTSFNVKLWSDQIKDMQQKLIYAESENIKASTDYRILKEEKENLLNQLKESHFQNDLLQKQLVETKTRHPVYNSSLIPFHVPDSHPQERERQKDDSLAHRKAMSTFSERTIPDEIFSKRTPERLRRKPAKVKPRLGYFLRRTSWTDLEEDFQRKYSTPIAPPPFFDDETM